MSDIWHKADEAPRYRFQCIYYHRDSKEYYFGEYDATFKVFLGKKTFHQCEAWKFAFAEDVIAGLDELERTRKALDVAVDALKELRPTEKKGCYLVPTVFTTQRIIDEALEQITALEQKDVK